MPGFKVDSRFDVPPEYARDWLTDYRPDDGQRYFGDKGPPAKVTRKGNEIVRTNESPPLGFQTATVLVESPTRWTATGDFKKGGKQTATFRIVETVQAQGKGTAHHVEGMMDGKTFGMRIMLPLMMPMMTKGLREAFAQMKTDMEASHKAGKPPTS